MFEDDATEELRHAICVSNLAYCVAKQYGLYEDPCHELAVAGMLHDIALWLSACQMLSGRAGLR